MTVGKDFCVNKDEHRIYCGNYSRRSHKMHGKTDVTEKVISAVFMWFIGHMDMEHNSYSITYENAGYDGYELIMFRKGNGNER